MELEKVLLQDLVLLSHRTYQLLNKIYIPGTNIEEAAELKGICLNILQRFTEEYGKEDGTREG